MEPRLFISAKAFIIFENTLLLLREASTNPDGTNAGKYVIPGGRLTPGETLQECLRREVYEETGLTITTSRPFSVSEWRPVVRGEQWQIVAVFFECVVVSNAIRLNKEHDAFQWIDPRNYKKYSLIDTIQQTVEEYLVFKNI